MSQLTYIKEAFFNNTKLELYLSPKTEQETGIYLEKFKEKWNGFREEMLKIKSEEDLKVKLNEMSQFFNQEVGIKLAQENIQMSYSGLINLAYSFSRFTQLNDIDKNIESYKKRYDSLIQVDPKADENIKERFIKQITQERIDKTDKETLQSLFDFGFSWIDLETIKKRGLGHDFTLEKMVNVLSKVCEDIGLDPNLIGLNNRLGLMFHNMDGAGGYYTPNLKAISMINYEETVFLHEWIHALDNYIFEKITGQNHYVSENTKVLVEQPHEYMSVEQKALHTAYFKIKEIIEDIENESKPLLNLWKDNKKEELSKRFWATTMGADWFALPTERRNSLLSKDVVEGIMNYCVNPSRQNQEYLNWKMRQNFVLSGVQADDILNNKQESIMNNCLPVLKDLNATKVIEKSQFVKINEQAWKLVRPQPGNQITAIFDKIMQVFETDKMKEKKSSFFIKNFGKDYYARSHEILSRYFEANVYPLSDLAREANKIVSTVYPKKDNTFSTKKDELIESVSKHFQAPFDKATVSTKISQMRAVASQRQDKKMNDLLS